MTKKKQTKKKPWVNVNSKELINCSTELKDKAKKGAEEIDKLSLSLALGNEERREGEERGRQAGREGGRKEVGRRELSLSSA